MLCGIRESFSPRELFASLASRACRFAVRGRKLDGERDLELTLRQSEWWGEGADRLRSDFGEFVYDDASGWAERARFRLSHDGSLNSRLYVPANKSESPTLAIWRDVSPLNHSKWTNSDWLPKEREVDLGPLRFALRPLRPTPEWARKIVGRSARTRSWATCRASRSKWTSPTIPKCAGSILAAITVSFAGSGGRPTFRSTWPSTSLEATIRSGCRRSGPGNCRRPRGPARTTRGPGHRLRDRQKVPGGNVHAVRANRHPRVRCEGERADL